MNCSWHARLRRALAALWLLAIPFAHANPGPLVDAAWLREALAAGDVLVLDAQPAKLHEAGHIVGAVHVDLFSYAADEADADTAQRRIRAWGVSPQTRVVIYDQGASYLGPRLFYELLYRGHPLERLHLLDGGLAQWRAAGLPLTRDRTAPPPAGTFRVAHRADVRAELPAVLAAAADPRGHALVDALEPAMYYGATKFFDRAGHLPHAISWPTAEFFNADKTFKSADAMRAMARHLGVRPDQSITSYCGGGIAAAVPFFALRLIAGYPDVKLFVGSQLAWVRDPRELPLWTYAAPHESRTVPWLAAWTNPMLRAYGVTRLNIVDVRTAEAYAAGHIPAARNVPAAELGATLQQPEALRARLAAEGIEPAHETVIVSERGVDRAAALAFIALQAIGLPQVSIVAPGMEDWALRGLPVTRQAAAPAPADRVADRGRAVRTTLAEAPAQSPRVYIASGAAAPTDALPGGAIHLPASRLVDADGAVRPAGALWAAIAQAGVPRHAQLVFVADDPGDAAINYYVFRLMGYPDLRVLSR